MALKCYCTGCGEDCSHAYGTWCGDPYHIGCIPERKRRTEYSDEEYNQRRAFAASSPLTERKRREWDLP